MSGFNRVTLLGNLGRDPEMRTTRSGQAVMNVALATSETWWDEKANGGKGERKERTEWHRVVIWGKRAEGLSKVLHKGDRILVEGSLRGSSYEKDGVKHYQTEVHAAEVVLCGAPRGDRRGDGQRSNESASPRGERQPARQDTRPSTSGSRSAPQGDAYEGPPPGADGDDDIPF